MLAGYDPRDPGSVDEPVPDYSAGLHDGIKGLRVGVPTNYFFDQLDEEVEAAARKSYEQLEALGAELVDVALPMPEQLGAVEFAILLPEASDYHRQMLRDSAHLYNDDVRVMLEAGEFVPATTYIRAQRVRNLLQQAFRKLYDKVDVIVAPTIAATAVTAGTESITWPDGSEEPLISAYTRFAVPGNVTGLPCLSVPCGFSSEGLPIGFQAIGRPLDEKGEPIARTIRQEDYMEARLEIPVAPQEQLAAAVNRAQGKRFHLPDAFARSVITHAFLGQLDVNPLGDVPGSRNNNRRWEFTGQIIDSVDAPDHTIFLLKITSGDKGTLFDDVAPFVHIRRHGLNY